jgi:hypothetical protein
VIKTWQAYDGGTDGRDCTLIGTFMSEEVAKRAAAGRGTMGRGDGDVRPGPVVYESWKEYKNQNPEAVRERALAKLTKEEREALGLH